MAERSKRTGIEQDAVLRELAVLSFSDVRHFEIDAAGYVKLRAGAPDEAMRAVASIKRRVRVDEDGDQTIETELKLWDKPAALRMAGTHLGLFVERHDVRFTGDLAERLAKARQRATGGGK